MAQLEPTSLTKYKLTEEEEVAGYILTGNNLLVLQNLLADAAENRLNLVYTPAEPLVFAQDESYLKGQIQILRYLIDQNQLHTERQLQLSMQTNSPE